MGLASVDFWGILDNYEEAPPSNVDPKMKKKYKNHVKNVMPIIVLNVADNQFVRIRCCKGLAKTWKTFCNIYERKILSNILFVCHKLFMCKTQECDDLLDNINKVNALAD